MFILSIADGAAESPALPQWQSIAEAEVLPGGVPPCTCARAPFEKQFVLSELFDRERRFKALRMRWRRLGGFEQRNKTRRERNDGRNRPSGLRHGSRHRGCRRTWRGDFSGRGFRYFGLTGSGKRSPKNRGGCRCWRSGRWARRRSFFGRARRCRASSNGRSRGKGRNKGSRAFSRRKPRPEE